MTLVKHPFEAGPQGTSLSNANSGSSTGSVSGGAAIFDAGVKAHGNFGAKFTNGAGMNCFRRWLLSAPAANWQFSGVVTIPAVAPATNVVVASFGRATDGAGRVQVIVDTSLRLGVQGAGGSGTTNITPALTGGAKYRVALVVEGGSATASKVTAKVYSESAGAWTTQVGSTYASTTFNAGTEDVVGVDLGIINSPAAALAVGWDDVQLNDGAGSEIGDLTDPLPLAAVTKGASTPATSVGGSDGTQVVTWTHAGGAASFEAWHAPGTTTNPADFTRVAEGVTSPYAFTGLPAGDHSYAIKAKA